jgi:hypothetical protein
MESYIAADDEHLDLHGHMFIPLPSEISSQYQALEEKIIPSSKGKGTKRPATSIEDIDTTGMDAKTLARLKVSGRW